MGRAELAVLREIYGDWEQGNFRRTDYLARDYELVFGRDFLDEGKFRGDEDVSRGWRAWLDQWASWRAIPLEYLEVDDRIAVRILVEGISKSTGMALTQESGNVFEFRDGLPWRITLYTRAATMLEDLGLESP
jgi:ketosteroid isomerase-like protein